MECSTVGRADIRVQAGGGDDQGKHHYISGPEIIDRFACRGGIGARAFVVGDDDESPAAAVAVSLFLEMPCRVGLSLAVKRHDCDPITLAQFAQGRLGCIGRALDGGTHVFPGIEDQHQIQLLLLVTERHDPLGAAVVGGF